MTTRQGFFIIFHFPFHINLTFKNHIVFFPPIKFSNHLQSAEILYILPTDPLHNNLLGAGNDACDSLEKHFESEMLKFYSENHFKNLPRPGQRSLGQGSPDGQETHLQNFVNGWATVEILLTF